MGVLAYVRQVFLDTDWSIRAQAAYEHNARVERPPYDRTEASLAAAAAKACCGAHPRKQQRGDSTFAGARGSMEGQRSDLWRPNGL